jgi:hypothetical protein
MKEERLFNFNEFVVAPQVEVFKRPLVAVLLHESQSPEG